jgi:ketosteroid isomerase-like protein
LVDNDKRLVREWLDMLASGPAEFWQGRVANDIVVRLPYAPPGVASAMDGIDQAIAAMTSHWDMTERFDWCDLVVRSTDDPGLYVTTARSDVLFRSGQRYANDYVIFTRIRDGIVIEHTEYFNPLPVIEMFKGA